MNFSRVMCKALLNKDVHSWDYENDGVDEVDVSRRCFTLLAGTPKRVDAGPKEMYLRYLLNTEHHLELSIYAVTQQFDFDQSTWVQKPPDMTVRVEYNSGLEYNYEEDEWFRSLQVDGFMQVYDTQADIGFISAKWYTFDLGVGYELQQSYLYSTSQ